MQKVLMRVLVKEVMEEALVNCLSASPVPRVLIPVKGVVKGRNEI